MSQLSVELSEEQSRFVSTMVTDGYYPDADTFVRDAVARLQVENDAKLEHLRALIQEGIDSGIYEGDPFEDVAREMGWNLEKAE